MVREWDGEGVESVLIENATRHQGLQYSQSYQPFIVEEVGGTNAPCLDGNWVICVCGQSNYEQVTVLHTYIRLVIVAGKDSQYECTQRLQL